MGKVEALLIAESIPHVVWMAVADGATTYFNKRGTDYTGITKVASHDWNSRRLVHPDDAERFRRSWDQAMESGTEYFLEYRIRRYDGVYRWHVFRGLPVRDEQNAIDFWIGTATDIEEQKRSEQDAEEALTMLESIEETVGLELTQRREAEEALARNVDAMVHTIARTVEHRDPYTAGHQHRVGQIAEAIARELGMEPSEVEGVHTAACIHDIGKISVPHDILSKSGRLLPAEMQLIKQHPDIGHDIVQGIDFPWPVAEMIRQHHERLDGSGYPRNLRGDEVLLGARIIAVADIVEAMVSHRPYRPSKGIDEAFDFITAEAGKSLDEAAVMACIAVNRRGRVEIAEPAIDQP